MEVKKITDNSNVSSMHATNAAMPNTKEHGVALTNEVVNFHKKKVKNMVIFPFLVLCSKIKSTYHFYENFRDCNFGTGRK